MKKITKVMALLLAVVMVFTGCATVEQTTVINSDGSARVTSVLDIDKEQWDSAIKKMGYTNPEAYFKSKLDYEDVSYYEIVTINGKKYYELREISGVSAKHLASDVNYALGVSKNGLYVTKDTLYGTVDYLTDDYEDFLEEAVSLGFNTKNSLKERLIFEFPANVVSTTGGIIDKTNPKKVTFNIDPSKKTTIFATTNKANTYNSIKKKVDKANTIKKPVIKSLKVKSIKRKKGTATLKLKKVKNVKYYIICSSSKKFNNEETIFIDTKKTSVTLKNLKKGKKYYVCIKAYKSNYAERYIESKEVVKTIKVVKKSKKK